MSRANNIRSVRKEAKMTIQRLADEIERTEGAVSLYERGKIDIPLSVLHRIARALQVPPSRLLPDTLDFHEPQVCPTCGHTPEDAA